jgi:thioester reductase-like protein
MLKQGGVTKLVDNCRTISILPEVGLIALHENDEDVVAAIEKVVSSLFAEAKELAGQQPDAFQNWSAPTRLILERLVEWANGENPDGLLGMRYQAWRPTFAREEAQTYLQLWQGLLI